MKRHDSSASRNSLYGEYFKLCVRVDWDPVDIKDFDPGEMRAVVKEYKYITGKQRRSYYG